jgi:hypothetical protein
MANKVKIARSGGSAGHTATTIPTGSNLEYGELAWLNGSNRLFIGRATSDPTSDDGDPAPYEITRQSTATVPGMASFDSGEFNISAYNLANNTGATVSLKDGGVANAHLSGITALPDLTGLDFTAGNRTLFGNQASGNILTIGNHSDGVVLIKGDLQVDGTTTTINSTIVTIDDKTFVVADGMNAASADEGGFFVSTVASLTFETTGTKWQSNIPIEASAFIGALTGNADSATTSAALTGTQASAITANTAKTGITSGQASAITANTAKTGITSGQASAITANTAKTGITSGQASAITANTAKTGITSGQASAIVANTAKVGTEGLATSRMLGNFDPGAGAVAVTKAQVLTFLNVADGATNTTDTNTWRGVTAGGNTLGTSETLAFTAGTNVTITENAGAVTITSTDTNTQLSTEAVQDIVGAMVTGNTETNIAVTYQDGDGTLDFVSTNTNLSTEAVQDIVGAMFSSNTETRIAATYQDGDGTIDLVVDAIPQGDITGVTAGTGMSGGGTSGAVTLNCTITNNNQLTNGAGYTTAVGDITAVTAGTGLTGGGTSGAVTLNVASNYLTDSDTIDGGTPVWT